MAQNAKTIKAKIKSVANVKKITKAMEKVSAVKMHRAVSQAMARREYAYHLYELLDTLLKHRELEHPLLVAPKNADRTLVVILSTDRGLCGGFNVQLQRAVNSIVGERSATTDAVCVGRKGELIAVRSALEIVASFVGLPDSIRSRDVASLTALIKQEFATGKYAKVYVVYNHFVSALSSTPIIYQLLPVSAEDIARSVKRLSKVREHAQEHADQVIDYVFEPDRATVLATIVPKAIEAKLFKMLAETRASEQSARMVAMKSASENAQTIIDDLSVSFNRARQEAITREISEIASGAAAISAV